LAISIEYYDAQNSEYKINDLDAFGLVAVITKNSAFSVFLKFTFDKAI